MVVYALGMATTRTTAKRDLPKATTTELIEQYDSAISSYSGRLSNHSPRQTRINLIVDLLATRADAGDADALAWLA